MTSPQMLQKLDWAFTDSPTDYLTHGYHQYPARFIPQIPRTVINALSTEGELVLDPFCGSGTTLVEATLTGRHAVGNDVNPISTLVSKVKTTPISSVEFALLDRWIGTTGEVAAALVGKPSLFKRKLPDVRVPAIPNIDHWFPTHVQRELGLITGAIEELPNRNLRDFCKVALSSIVVTVSNQDSETRYTRRAKSIAPGEPFARFIRKLKAMQLAMDEYVRLRTPVNVQVILGDARELTAVKSESVALIITSPPYPNAFDYHLYHRHRLFWLGFDPRDLMRAEIGSHLNYQRNGENIGEFERDMRQCFSEISRVLLPGRYCAMVIGDSIFNGEIVHNDELLTQVALEADLELAEGIKRAIHQTKRSLPFPARRATNEHILIFRKARRG